MSKIKTRILVTAFNVTSLAILFLYYVGISMGLEHFLNPIVAAVMATIYIGTFGRYRIRYGLIPSLLGMLIDVGIWKTLIFFILPQAILFAVSISITYYAYSFLNGSRRFKKPDFDLLVITSAVSRFHPGAAQDARDIGKNLENSA